MDQRELLPVTSKAVDAVLRADRAKGADFGGHTIPGDVTAAEAYVDEESEILHVRLSTDDGREGSAAILPNEVKVPQGRPLFPADIESAVHKAMIRASAHLAQPLAS